MIGIVIVAHGGLALEYLGAIQHVVGQQSGIVAIRVHADYDRDEKQAEICAAVRDVDCGHGVVVVTDMFGSSPANLSLAACGQSDHRVLYGANLPMLVKLATCRRKPMDVAIRNAVDAGRKYMGPTGQ